MVNLRIVTPVEKPNWAVSNHHKSLLNKAIVRVSWGDSVKGALAKKYRTPVGANPSFIPGAALCNFQILKSDPPLIVGCEDGFEL